MPFLSVQDMNFVLYPIYLLVACETDSSDRAGQRQTLALRSRILRFCVDQNLPRVGLKIRRELAWPASRDDRTNLNSSGFGTLVRAARVEAEVRITTKERYPRRKVQAARVRAAACKLAGRNRDPRAGSFENNDL